MRVMSGNRLERWESKPVTLESMPEMSDCMQATWESTPD